MNSLTPHTSKRHTAQAHSHSPMVTDRGRKGKHPDRAAILAHLQHLHNRLNAPGMAEHPLTPSEHQAVQDGAGALMRGVPSGPVGV
jgi:hypothetical protein